MVRHEAVRGEFDRVLPRGAQKLRARAVHMCRLSENGFALERAERQEIPMLASIREAVQMFGIARHAAMSAQTASRIGSALRQAG